MAYALVVAKVSEKYHLGIHCTVHTEQNDYLPVFMCVREYTRTSEYRPCPSSQQRIQEDNRFLLLQFATQLIPTSSF